MHGIIAHTLCNFGLSQIKGCHCEKIVLKIIDSSKNVPQKERFTASLTKRTWIQISDSVKILHLPSCSVAGTVLPTNKSSIKWYVNPTLTQPHSDRWKHSLNCGNKK